ncbi:SH3 domain-containing protein [Hominifimenecus sp. rT4P-3]|uniref:SH3 domain-containing protein n=1 Tax=Hominifimenecus sp. rT4P-3 TaxID=3242979 RepID=UPI003DA48575
MKRKKSDVIIYVVIAAVFCLQLAYTAVRTDKVSQVEAAGISTISEEKEGQEEGDPLPMVDIHGQIAQMAASLSAQVKEPATEAPETTPESIQETEPAVPESRLKFAEGIDVAALEAEAAAAAESRAAQESTTVDETKLTAAELRAEQAYQESKAEESPVSENAPEELGVVNASVALNVRQTPGEDGELVGRLYRGAGVKIQETGEEWSRILSGEVNGWVLSSYLVTGEPAEALVSEMNPQVATVVTDELCVRSGPDEEADLLAVIRKGMHFSVLELQDSWVKIQLTTQAVGYIHADYVSVASGLSVGMTISEEAELQAEVNDREETRQAAAEAAAARKAAQESKNNSSKKNSSSSSKKDNSSSSKKENSSSSNKNNSEGSSSSSSKDGWRSLGTFKITAYCPCSKCNGSNAGQTATGAEMEPGYTIAVDSSVIPLGSRIKIEGKDGVYCAQDTGVSGHTIDLLVSSHSKTSDWGVRYREIWIED